MGTIARGTKAGGGTNLNSGQVADPAEVNLDFNTAYTEINGALDDTNIETATIPGAKSLRFTGIAAPSAPSTGDLLLYLSTTGVLSTKNPSAEVIGLGGTIDSIIATAATGADTTETTLWSVEVGNSLLSDNGQSLHFVALISFASNANDKTIRVKFGGTILYESVITDTTAGATVAYRGTIWRIAASGANSQVGVSDRSANAAVVGGSVSSGAFASETLTGSVTFAVTGQNAVASGSDILLRAAWMGWSAA